MAKRRGHNQGSITEMKNGDGKPTSYRAQISVPGGGRKSLGYFKTRKEAQHAVNSALALAAQGRLSTAKSQTVEQYFQAWLSTVEHSVRHRTYISYELNVRRLTRHIGKIRLDALKPAHVQDCCNALTEQDGLKPQTVHQVMRTLHKALKDAMVQDLVVRNASEGITMPRVAKKEMPTYSLEELSALFQATAGDRFHALWVVLGMQGLRIGEAMGLKWEDIDWENGTLAIRRALQRHRKGGGLLFVEPKSVGSRRTIDLHDVTITALRQREEQQAFERKHAGELWEGQDLIFATVTGSPFDPNRVNEHFRAAVRNAGLQEIRVHDMRHTAATIHIESGAEPHEVQKMLGHSNISLTLGTYSHVTPPMRRRTTGAVGKRLQHAVTQREPVAG